VVEQLMTNLNILAEFGAKHFLLNTIPDPADESLVALLEPFKIHNQLFKKSVDDFVKKFNVNVNVFEADKEFPTFTSKKFQEETGITKGFDEPCIPLEVPQINSSTPVCDNPELFLLFDKNHPTTKVHQFIASLIFGFYS